MSAVLPDLGGKALLEDSPKDRAVPCPMPQAHQSTSEACCPHSPPAPAVSPGPASSHSAVKPP